jgi:hypothetical protein
MLPPLSVYLNILAIESLQVLSDDTETATREINLCKELQNSIKSEGLQPIWELKKFLRNWKMWLL